jgi:hypothetical protein
VALWLECELSGRKYPVELAGQAVAAVNVQVCCTGGYIGFEHTAFIILISSFWKKSLRILSLLQTSINMCNL